MNIYPRIVIGVIFVHLLLLLFLAISPQPPTVVVPHRLLVKTIQLKPQEKPTVKIKRPKRKKKTIKKKKQKKITDIEKTRRQKLLKEAKASIDQVQQTKKTSPTTLAAAPQAPQNLTIDTVYKMSNAEQNYFIELTRTLQNALSLPEHGEVKLKLDLSRQGQVINIHILHSANTTNQHYIEKTIPNLSFPPFGKYFAKETKHSFTVLLKNERTKGLPRT